MPIALFIEDNTEIRENISELLELEGFEALSAADGENGIRLAREKRPDIILCDIMMQGTDGYEVLRRLRADPYTSFIPFIFVTAKTENNEIQIGLDMGANGYIKKPFDPKELFAAIELCLIVP